MILKRSLTLSRVGLRTELSTAISLKAVQTILSQALKYNGHGFAKFVS